MNKIVTIYMLIAMTITALVPDDLTNPTEVQDLLEFLVKTKPVDSWASSSSIRDDLVQTFKEGFCLTFSRSKKYNVIFYNPRNETPKYLRQIDLKNKKINEKIIKTINQLDFSSVDIILLGESDVFPSFSKILQQCRLERIYLHISTIDDGFFTYFNSGNQLKKIVIMCDRLDFDLFKNLFEKISCLEYRLIVSELYNIPSEGRTISLNSDCNTSSVEIKNFTDRDGQPANETPINFHMTPNENALDDLVLEFPQNMIPVIKNVESLNMLSLTLSCVSISNYVDLLSQINTVQSLSIALGTADGFENISAIAQKDSLLDLSIKIQEPVDMDPSDVMKVISQFKNLECLHIAMKFSQKDGEQSSSHTQIFDGTIYDFISLHTLEFESNKIEKHIIDRLKNPNTIKCVHLGYNQLHLTNTLTHLIQFQSLKRLYLKKIDNKFQFNKILKFGSLQHIAIEEPISFSFLMQNLNQTLQTLAITIEIIYLKDLLLKFSQLQEFILKIIPSGYATNTVQDIYCLTQFFYNNCLTFNSLKELKIIDEINFNPIFLGDLKFVNLEDLHYINSRDCTDNILKCVKKMKEKPISMKDYTFIYSRALNEGENNVWALGHVQQFQIRATPPQEPRDWRDLVQ